MKKVYICTPLKLHKFRQEAISKTILENPGYFAFVPLTSDMGGPTLGAALDKRHLDLADEVWVFGPFGRDCAWEIGYALGLNKKVIVWITDDNREYLKTDWMLWCHPNCESREFNHNGGNVV